MKSYPYVRQNEAILARAAGLSVPSPKPETDKADGGAPGIDRSKVVKCAWCDKPATNRRCDARKRSVRHTEERYAARSVTSKDDDHG